MVPVKENRVRHGRTGTPKPPRQALNRALFAALVVMLLCGIVLSFPAIRAVLRIDHLLGYLPPTPAALTRGVRISEVMTSNKSTIPDETGAFPDYIELCNTSEDTVNMAGYTLSDRIGRAKFVFPNIVIEPGAYLIVFASGIERSVPGAAMHAPMKLSAAGETLYLCDNTGADVESILLPQLSPDESYARIIGRWTKTDTPTPGYPNTDEGREAFLASIVQVGSGLQLNEIMASNAVTLKDEDGDTPDWIELFNASPLSVDLSGFALSDDPDKPVKWRFPQGAVISPYTTFVVFASGKAQGSAATPHASFRLRADHGVVILSDIAGNIIDMTEYDNLATDAVWARRRNDSPWEKTSQPTPGTINP